MARAAIAGAVAGREIGDLVAVVAWLAAVPMTAGDVFRAELDRLGPITIRVGA